MYRLKFVLKKSITFLSLARSRRSHLIRLLSPVERTGVSVCTENTVGGGGVLEEVNLSKLQQPTLHEHMWQPAVMGPDQLPHGPQITKRVESVPARNSPT